MTEVGRKSATGSRKFDPPRLEASIAALAACQQGVISLAQLRSAGLSARAVQDRAAVGRLHRLHHGVYAVGHTVLTREGRWMAAVLACGKGAILSHGSAAAHLGLRQTSSALVDVTVPRRSGHSRPAISLHRCRSLAPEDVTVVNGIPCASVARTVIDVADREPRRNVERLIDQAEILRTFDLGAFNAAIERAPGRRGPAVVRAILGGYEADFAITRSEFEERMLQICTDADLPRSEVNAWIPLRGGDIEGDFVWRKERVVAEADGYASHGTRRAFVLDRARDRRLTLAGWRVLHFTWGEMLMSPRLVADELRGALGSGR